MKRPIALVLVCLLVLAAFGSAVAEQTVYGFHGDETVAEQVVFDAEGVRITATGLGIVRYAPVLKLWIENNSGRRLSFEITESALNDWMWDATLCLYEDKDGDPEDDVYSSEAELTVADGEKLACGLGFDNEYYYEPCGISGVGEMSFGLRACDPDSGESVFTTPVIDVATSLGADYPGLYVDAGSLAYDGHDVRVLIPGLHSDGYAGSRVMVYANNYSDGPVYISLERCVVNGNETEAWFSANASPGRQCLAEIGFAEEIPEIHTLAVAFRVEGYSSADMAEPTFTDVSDVVELEF